MKHEYYDSICVFTMKREKHLCVFSRKVLGEYTTKQVFTNTALLTFRASSFAVGTVLCIVDVLVASLYSLKTSASSHILVVTTQNISKYYQMSQGAKLLWVENSCTKRLTLFTPRDGSMMKEEQLSRNEGFYFFVLHTILLYCLDVLGPSTLPSLYYTCNFPEQ